MKRPQRSRAQQAEILRRMEEILALPANERGAYLDTACEGRSWLREALDTALSHMEELEDVDTDAHVRCLPSPVDAGLAALPEGSVIGPYILEGALQQGGMGAIFRARQRQPSRPVALKFLRQVLSEVTRQRFEREVQLLATLEHSGIARIYSAGTHLLEEEGETYRVPYFAMELVLGAVSLTAYCDQHSCAADERLELFLQATEAVRHSHRKAVLHRDLKPENVLVDVAGQVKVIDFGIARLADEDSSDLTRFGDSLGTQQYMSPEQRSGSASVDVRTDIYSLGVILGELWEPVLRGTIAYSRGLVPEDVTAVIRRATAQAPAERYPTTDAFRDDLRRCRDGISPTASRRSRVRQTTRWVRRHWLAATTVLLIVGMGIRAALFTIRNDRAEQRFALEQLSRLHPIVREFAALKGVPGTTDPLRAHLTDVWRQLAELSETLPEHPMLLETRAVSLEYNGDQYQEEKNYPAALAAFHDALLQRQALAARDPENPNSVEALSITLVRIGDQHKELHHLEEAERYYQEAFAIDKALVDQYPSELRYVDNLTWSYERLSDLAEDMDNPEQSRSFAQKRHGLSLQLLERNQLRTESYHTLAASHLVQFRIANEGGDPDQAADHIQQARHLARVMVEREPHQLIYTNLLLACFLKSYEVSDNLGDPGKDSEDFESTYRVLRDSLSRWSESVVDIDRLIKWNLRLAELMMQHERPALSAESFESAIAILRWVEETPWRRRRLEVAFQGAAEQRELAGHKRMAESLRAQADRILHGGPPDRSKLWSSAIRSEQP